MTIGLGPALVGGGNEPTALERRDDAGGDLVHELRDILIGRLREGTEASALGLRIDRKDALYPECV